ncbi:MAG TPA: PVC-type heme-binding CxxCH protein, partial [Planctomycetaceae bacterium]
MSLGTAALLLGLAAADPRVHDPAYELSLVAADPDLVTPVGLAFDERGRLLVIESHTHFRPEGYEGPPADRIRLAEDTDGDGKADRFRSFYEGSNFTMGLRPGPDGWMYVATRQEVFRLKDADGDGTAETREDVVRLVTEGDYPHNGLSGLAFGPDDKLWFGMGENLGEPYELVGKLYIGMGQNRGAAYDLHGGNGNRIAGGGEGGNVFRCDPDGGNLERVATGFWNPFGLCFDPHGRLFAVDNDPDASPPCRLLHVVPGGDYGFQFRYGRAGRHPLQAWDGELPGTLPMAAGTGEAPCAVVPHEGRLWVTSWGHHRIERFAMRHDGATVVGVPEVVVQGDENFRPVDLAVAPNGDLYFTDWVDKSYPLHGKGRLWRLRKKEGAPAASASFPPLSDDERRAAEARAQIDLAALASDDPFLRQAAAWGLVTAKDISGVRWEELSDARQRLGLLEAKRWRGDMTGEARNELLAKALDDPDADVRLYAVRWIADERIEDLQEA